MKKIHFYHPKYWSTWIAIALMKVSIIIPFKAQLFLSKLFAPLFIIIAYKKYQIAKINISLCFPHLSDSEIIKLTRKHFIDFFMSLFETALCFYAPKKRLKKCYTITNTELLDVAIQNKKNVILLAGHFTTLMITGRILTDTIKVANIYRPQNNKLFNNVMIESFIANGAKMVSSKNTKEIIKILKNGMPIWYAPDQDLGNKNSVFAPFFNIPTNTITATTKLANISNATVLFFSAYRDHSSYKCSFIPIENFPTEDVIKDATTINAYIEQEILRSPSQYLWTHRRFKTRPEGESKFY